MINYISKRIMLAAVTRFFVSFLSYVIIDLPPGDYVDKLIEIQVAIGQMEIPTAEEEYALREKYDLNKPMLIRYVDWIWKILSDGNFGPSYGSGSGYTASGFGTPVSELFGERIILTIALAAFTMIITWLFSVPVGIYTAVRQHSIGDYTFTFLGFAGLAVPDFLLGLILMYLMYAYFDQSVGGLFSGPYQDAPWSFARVIDMLKHLIIPAVVIGTSGTAGLIRILRNNLLDEIEKPYVVTAKSKGIGKWKLIIKYPLRVAINPFVSGMGYMLPALISGSVIVSVVLGLNTMGPLLVDALRSQDVNVAGAIILMLGVLTVFGTLISDLLLVLVDPRIKLVE